MKVLIIGAGAVGQVYGYHMHLGGADITFYVREKYAADLRQYPLTLHQLDWRGRRVEWSNYKVITTFDEIKNGQYDVVLNTISGAAIREGEFMGNLLSSVSPTATVMPTTAGPDDDDIYTKKHGFPKERIVQCHIGFIAWQAPMEGEAFHPVAPASYPNKAIGYTLSSDCILVGSSERVQPVYKVFKRGRMPVHKSISILAEIGPLFTFLHPLLYGLHVADWSFASLREHPELPSLVVKAIKEAVNAINLYSKMVDGPRLTFGIRFRMAMLRFVFVTLLSPWLLKLISRMAPKVMPFDIETYLHYHFAEKLWDQTLLAGDQIVKLADQVNAPSGYVKQIHEFAKAKGLPIKNYNTFY